MYGGGVWSVCKDMLVLGVGDVVIGMGGWGGWWVSGVGLCVVFGVGRK